MVGGWVGGGGGGGVNLFSSPIIAAVTFIADIQCRMCGFWRNACDIFFRMPYNIRPNVCSIDLRLISFGLSYN